MNTAAEMAHWTPVLRVPPFPGALVTTVARRTADQACATPQIDRKHCVAALRHHRVGGSFWAAQPALDPARRLVVRPADSGQAQTMLARARELGLADRIQLWLPVTFGWRPGDGTDPPFVVDPCDPWHMIGHADALWVDASDEVALLARIADVEIITFGEGPFATGTAEALVAEHLLAGVAYVDPFEDRTADALGIIELLGSWRALIDANRPIEAAVGFARWKRETVEPLLWHGGGRVRFAPANAATLASLRPGAGLAIWKARVPAAFLAEAEQGSAVMHEVEDGFIRSSGLGANCVPPLSIVVDRLGVHFDPGGASELEQMLESSVFDAATLDQAAQLRAAIRHSGLSKYEAGASALPRPGGARRHILVPGQVEDDRSVLCGGGGVAGNLDLLSRVRAREPEAFILYKPHPDVEAGHRKGKLMDADVERYADMIVRDASISALIDMVDAVHVLTSLAGFEALLRDKAVTTHGVPFYAGWGLTTDLGAVPARRRRCRTVAELIAAVLIAYPRYLNPVTMLPCPPSVLVARLAGGGVRRQNAAIVSLRRMQGALRRGLSRIGAAA